MEIDIDKVAQNMSSNMERIEKLRAKVVSDIREAKTKKNRYERELRRHLNPREEMMQIFGAGYLILLLQLRDNMQRNMMAEHIHNRVYDYEQIADIEKVMRDRYTLLIEAKNNGVELTEESQQALIEDKLSFLLADKEREVFKDAEYSRQFNAIKLSDNNKDEENEN